MQKTWMLVLLAVSFQANCDEVSLGLWSHHFDRNYAKDKCVNETHNLVTYQRSGIVAGGYKNSHCKQSWLAGYQGNIYKDLGYTVSVVSGYPKGMHLIDNYIVVPMLHYTFYTDLLKFEFKKKTINTGVRVYYIPDVLIAIGSVTRF